jgi:hypothetical protein
MSTSKLDDDVNVKLAIYMERLDNYIQSQNALNESICRNLDVLESDLVEVRTWRSRMYGVKTGAIAIGLLLLHTSAVMGGFVAILRWWDK